jgi:hypothetical protein
MCVVWNGALNGAIGLYRRCQTEAGWSAPELSVALGGTARDFVAALTPDETLVEIHVVGAGDVMFGDLELSDEGLAVLPALAVDARGDLHVAWVSLGQQTGDPFSVVHRHRYTVEGGVQQLWLDSDIVSADESAPGGLSLALAADAHGGVHIAWGGSGMYYSAWTLQNGWGPIVTLVPESVGLDLDLAVDAEGGARAVWARAEGMYYAAQGANGAWSERRLVVEVIPGLQSAERPHLVVDAQGLTHTVWITSHDVYYMTLP